MTPHHTPIAFGKLAEQIAQLLAAGGTLGSIYDLTGQDCEVMYSLGHGLYAQGRFADAVKVFGFLAMHNHLERRYLNAFAAALQMTGSHEDAIKFYTLASAMDPRDPAPTFHTCECLIALGMTDTAIDGLKLVAAQCGAGGAHGALAVRARALLDMLEKPAAPAPAEAAERGGRT